MNYSELSKEVSYALRHAPWEYELEMEEKYDTISSEDWKFYGAYDVALLSVA